MRKLLKYNESQLMRYSKQIENNYILKGLIEKDTEDRPIIVDDMVRPFLRKQYTNMLAKCKKEWVIEVDEFKYLEEEICICELCGHKRIKNVCVIRNIYTNKKLKVGTGCINNIHINKNINFSSIFYKIKLDKDKNKNSSDEKEKIA